MAAEPIAFALPAQAQDAGQAADVVINMRGVEIADVADQVSRITGRTLILDPAVKGPVTVTSATPLTPGGVWELFLSVLRANGWAAISSGPLVARRPRGPMPCAKAACLRAAPRGSSS
ncbi:MAG: hypothetical protein WDN24_14540 [Sphingomonas sp.]